MTDFNPLALENQLCFPLYAASKEITRRYKPFLDPLGLTYTQYVAMMVLWEHDGITVGELGSKLYLDSATLTPLLKRLEAHGFVRRERSHEDERAVIVAARRRAGRIDDQVDSAVRDEVDEVGPAFALLERERGRNAGGDERVARS
ncbi:MAG: MarR family transcriptional regulator, partial [Atopobiaceae bacterium]|nr:MarR family transcriptional regulator [Atopobiaceae bacterium]